MSFFSLLLTIRNGMCSNPDVLISTKMYEHKNNNIIIINLEVIVTPLNEHVYCCYHNLVQE